MKDNDKSNQLGIKSSEKELFYELPAGLKIMYWFFSFPGKSFSLNDLASGLSISKISARKAVEEFVKEGFLHREMGSKLWKISCNKEHRFNRTIKIAFNLTLIYESGLLESIKEAFPDNKAIVLLGDYRSGQDDEKSPIEIAIFSPEHEGEIKDKHLGNLGELGYRRDVPVKAHVYYSHHIIDKKNLSEIANGIVLDGKIALHS